MDPISLCLKELAWAMLSALDSLLNCVYLRLTVDVPV